MGKLTVIFWICRVAFSRVARQRRAFSSAWREKRVAALSLPEHQRWRRSLNSGQDIRPVAGYSTLIRYSTPLAFGMGATCTGGTRQRRDAYSRRLVRINRQGDDLHIETQNVAHRTVVLS